MLRPLALFLGFVSAAFAATAPAPQPATGSPSLKWAAAIDRLTAHDASHPPAPGGVVFVGSSSIVKWTTLAADFPDHAVVNRGFGGSELADSVYYADRIVLPYRPRTVVVYAGENDIADGKTPERVRADFVAFERLVHGALPHTRIIYIGLKPSPSRWQFRAAMERTNQLVRAACAAAPRCTFVDVWSRMLDAHGQPRRDLFQPDMLHMNPAGYAIWRGLVSPLLPPDAPKA